ncbi:MAG: hypothetical protein ACE367_27075 [Acidimicrobiales bacterium]
MAPTDKRRVRPVVALLGVGALVAACAQPGGTPRLESAGPVGGGARAAEALEIIVEDDPTLTENVRPDLLGFDPPTGPPPVLAMTDEPADAVPDVVGTDVASDVVPAEAEPAAETEPVEASEDGADTPEEEAGADRSFATLPLPLPATPGGPPLYDDPSEMLERAAARPFPTGLAATSATERGVTRNAIRVGAIVSSTLAGAPLRGDACLGAEARYRQAEVNSELSRRIDFVACHDDTGRADIGEGLAGSLLDDDVFAIAPLSSVAFIADEALTDAAVPHIGDGALPAWCGRHTPFGFGIGGAISCPVLDARGYTVLSAPVLTALTATGDDLGRILILAPDGPEGAAVVASRLLEAELAGIDEPEVGPALPDVADGVPTSWGQIVTAVVDAAPDTVILDGGVSDGLPAALRSRGFAGTIVLVGEVDPLDVADADLRAELAPLTVVTHGMDLAGRTSAGWTAIVAAAAGIDVAPNDIGIDFVRGYAAADVLVQALAATPPPLTSEALVDTMNSGWWYPGIDGVTCGAWWPAAHYIELPCVSVALVEADSPVLVPVVDLVETAPQLRFGL